MNRVGIRREDKNPWERRAPLTPSQAARLIESHKLDIYVQPSTQRVFPDAAYRQAGAMVEEDLSSCSVILGVKEIPRDFFYKAKTYLFFSHTIKGQPYNMPMLSAMMAMGCQLIDYERIVDETGKRLVLFGRHAGLAGMIESLHALGKRLTAEGLADDANPFAEIKQPYLYKELEEAKAHLREIAKNIRSKGLPTSLTPLVVAFLGYGNVANGAMEILDCLPCVEVQPEDLKDLAERDNIKHVIFKVVFREEDTVEPIDTSKGFSLDEYYRHPDRYLANFSRFLPHLTVLINAIYWDQRFPVLVDAHHLKELFAGPQRPALRVIGDITCDIEGSIAVTRKATLPDNPCYVYDAIEGCIGDGVSNLRGPVIMAVDILPTEFPVEASDHFGNALLPFLPALASCNFSSSFERLNLPEPIKRAMILHQGKLTADYKYLEKYVREAV